MKKKKYNDRQQKIARYAKALGNPARVAILDYFADNEEKYSYSGNLAEVLPIARSTLSQHLKELKEAGLIQGEKNPPYIKYCINRQNWIEAKDLFKVFFKRRL